MKYQVSKKYKSTKAVELWSLMIELLIKLEIEQILSISGSKAYKLVAINNQQIGYVGEGRNNGEEETLYKEDFINLLEVLQQQQYFSTSSIKEYISGPVYKKRSPSFAVLKSLEIIV